jgi:hypothetical protein
MWFTKRCNEKKRECRIKAVKGNGGVSKQSHVKGKT